MRSAAIVPVLLTLVGLAGLVHAHSVPVDPSVCTFQPLALAAPAVGFEAVAAPATDADRFRIVYDPAASLLQVCGADRASPTTACADVPPRPFSAGGVAGAVGLSLFQGRLTAAGDVAVESAPVDVTVGGQSARLGMPLTTGLVLAGPVVAEGAALTPDGTFTLVGAGGTSALPAPLGGTALLLRMTCRATPAPDLDQFAPAATMTSFAGTVGTSLARVRATLDADVTSPDFSRPALVRLSTAGTAIATLALPAGLTQASRRRFTGASADGLATITVRAPKRRGRYRLVLRLPAPVLPTTTEKRVQVQLTSQVGGLLARGFRAFRVKRPGLRAP